MFSIVIPLFNEAKNIELLLKEIDKSLKNFKNYEIVIVNDASTDDTKKVLKKIKNKNIHIITNKTNKGQSFSICEGIKNSSYETIITIDGDGQNDPSDITKLYNLYIQNNQFELVGGIRKNRKDSLIKIFSSKVANYIRSKILKDGCKDTGCSLKVFNKKIFLSFPFFNGIHRFLPALFRGYGFKTAFIEVNHRKRIYGISKYGTINRLFVGMRDIIKVKKILKNKFL